METKEYPAEGGAYETTPQAYPTDSVETCSSQGICEIRAQLDTRFLTSLLNAGANARRVIDCVEEEDFSNPVYGALYRRMRALAAAGELTPDRLLANVSTSRWGQDHYWKGVFFDIVAPGRGSGWDVALIASNLVQMSWRAQLEAIGKELASAATERTVDELDELLASDRMKQAKATRERYEQLHHMCGGVK